jgi:hypothetical protein
MLKRLAFLLGVAAAVGGSLLPVSPAGASGTVVSVPINPGHGFVAATYMAATPQGGGYWVAGLDGGVFSFGDARFYGSVPGALGHVPAFPISQIAPTPDGGGYWLAGGDGGVYAFGDAQFYGSVPGALGRDPANAVVGFAPTPDGRGYWLVDSIGGVYAFGDALFYGSLPGSDQSTGQLYSPCTSDGSTCLITSGVISITATADGGGYWILDSDGDVFNYGDAPWYGSVPNALGGRVPPGGVISMTATPTGKGYWILGNDGGVYSFGSAQFHGSLPGIGLPVAPITLTQTAPTSFTLGIPTSIPSAIASTRDGQGYWVVGLDGGVFSFGDAQFYGSVPGAGASVLGVASLCGPTGTFC